MSVAGTVVSPLALAVLTSISWAMGRMNAITTEVKEKCLFNYKNY